MLIVGNTSLSRCILQIKDEAWWLVLGNTSTSELYALKRVSFSDRLVTRMDLPSSFTTVQVNMPSLQSLWLFFYMSFLIHKGGRKYMLIQICEAKKKSGRFLVKCKFI